MPSEPDMNVVRPDRPGIRKVLGDLEADIMEIIWSHPSDNGVPVREVFEILYDRRRIAYTTVMSTMARLAKKKLLRAEKRDQAYFYYPIFTQEQFVARFVGHVLDNLLVGFSEATLDRLKNYSEHPADQRVQQLLDEIARRRADEEEE